MQRTNTEQATLRLEGLVRTYRQGPREIHVLRGASAALHGGEIVGLVGPSGAGKSSLLHMAGLLERPDAGQVILDGRDCTRLADSERTRIRRREIGYVYQFHHLLPEFSALENVVLPQRIMGRGRREAEVRAAELLGRLGLDGRHGHRPGELSGGEQHPWLIGERAGNGDTLLLADEPTGNLDPETADRVFDELIALVRGAGVAALVATHNMALAERMDRVLKLEGGVLHPID